MLIKAIKKELPSENGEQKIHVTKELVSINGSTQGLIIESTNTTQPVLLFLHGCGFPAYPLIKANNVHLEQYFTVCYWDQRGAGMSFNRKEAKTSMTINQTIDDVIAVTQYLRKKFAVDKVFLLCHSWGTFIGSLAAKQAPELYYAYIGVGQIGCARESERESYEFFLDKATEKLDTGALKQLNNVPYTDTYYTDHRYGNLRTKYANKFGGGMKREGYPNSLLFRHIMACPMYSIGEKINFFRGMEYTARSFLKEMGTNDLVKLVEKLEIPMFILHGKHDYTTTYRQGKRFFISVAAPFKRMYTFHESAHSPYIDEKERFYKIIQQIQSFIFVPQRKIN